MPIKKAALKMMRSDKGREARNSSRDRSPVGTLDRDVIAANADHASADRTAPLIGERAQLAFDAVRLSGTGRGHENTQQDRRNKQPS